MEGPFKARRLEYKVSVGGRKSRSDEWFYLSGAEAFGRHFHIVVLNAVAELITAAFLVVPLLLLTAEL